MGRLPQRGIFATIRCPVGRVICVPGRPLLCERRRAHTPPISRETQETPRADNQPARPQGPADAAVEDQDAGAAWCPAEAGGLHARLHHHPEKAELGAAQGRARPADERDGGHDVHPRRGAQPAGALRGVDPRRPRQGPAGHPLQGHPRRTGHGRSLGPQAGPVEVRSQEELMPRRADITPRELEADPVHGSKLVTQFINAVMLDGKRSTAERLVYDALAIVSEKTGKPPVEALEAAVKTVTPVLEVRSRRVGGANYQVPVEVPQRRGRTLALRWLVTFSRDRREKHMSDKLAGEILDALESQGNAFKRKDDMYRMAQANKAFAHYRW